MDSITTIQSGIWNKNAVLKVEDIWNFGKWGFVCTETDVEAENTTKAISISEIMKRFNREEIDILKMDIEGAEYSVFADIFNSARKVALPFQISFESHWWHHNFYHTTLHQQMFNELWKNGYRFLNHEFNPGDDTCVEWTLLPLYNRASGIKMLF